MTNNEAINFPLDQFRKVQMRCYATAVEKGWWEKYERLRQNHLEIYKELLPEIISSKLTLMHSEISEALEELRKGVDPTKVYYTATIEGEHVVGDYETVKNALSMTGRKGEPKPEGIPIEFADVVIRLFDLAEFLGIDLPHAVREKMIFNDTRSYKHGGKAI